MKVTDVEHRGVDIDERRVSTRTTRSTCGACARATSSPSTTRNASRSTTTAGQTVMLRSRDEGETWTDRTVVLPYTRNDRQLGLRHLRARRRHAARRTSRWRRTSSAASGPSSRRGRAARCTDEWGDWTWSYKTMGWLGTYVLRSTDGGATWSEPIPVNARPLKHAGCRLGCWPMPERLAAHGRLRPHPRLRRRRRERVDALRAAALRRRRLQLGVLLDDGVRRREHRRLRGAGDRAARRRPHRRHAAHAREPERRRQEHGDRRVGRRRLLVVAAALHEHLGLSRRVRDAARRPHPHGLRLPAPALRRARLRRRRRRHLGRRERVHDPRGRCAGRVLRQPGRLPAHRLPGRGAPVRRLGPRDVPRAHRRR